MAESIFARVNRLLSARIEDSVDAMERTNSDVIMREAIREVDRVIDAVRSDQQEAMTRRLQSAKQHEIIAAKSIELTEKARFALNEGREDLAEAALHRQVDLEGQIERLKQVQANARQEEARLEESLSALHSRKQQMQEALATFMIARSEASIGGDGGFDRQFAVERKVNNAEAAFDRAMTGGGGAGFSREDSDAITRVAEIDGLQKNKTVADRLAALKQETGKAA